MRSSNPTLSDNTFLQVGHTTAGEAMTIQGVAFKTTLLLLLMLLTAGWTWTQFFQAGRMPDAVSGWMMVGLVGGLITAIATVFKPIWSPLSAPIYALLEGLFLGGISAILEVQFPGIVIQAAMLTFGTMAMMLFLYGSRIIKVTEKFKLGVVAATGGIALVYIVTLVLGFFGVSVPFVFSGGIGGIIFSLFVVCVASLNLILDFDFIEKGAERGAPKYMEWYGSFALMVTLIWLYIEFLRLLSKARSR